MSVSSSVPRHPALFAASALDILRRREKRDKVPSFIFGRDNEPVEKNRQPDATTPPKHTTAPTLDRSFLHLSRLLPSPGFSAFAALPLGTRGTEGTAQGTRGVFFSTRKRRNNNDL